MYALRERRQHVTQEDFEFAIAKVCFRIRDILSLPLANDKLSGGDSSERPLIDDISIHRFLSETRMRTHLSVSYSAELGVYTCERGVRAGTLGKTPLGPSRNVGRLYPYSLCLINPCCFFFRMQC